MKKLKLSNMPQVKWIVMDWNLNPGRQDSKAWALKKYAIKKKKRRSMRYILSLSHLSNWLVISLPRLSYVRGGFVF